MPRAGGLVLVEMDDFENIPRYGVGEQQVPEDLGFVTQLVRVEAVNGGILRALSAWTVSL